MATECEGEGRIGFWRKRLGAQKVFDGKFGGKCVPFGANSPPGRV